MARRDDGAYPQRSVMETSGSLGANQKECTASAGREAEGWGTARVNQQRQMAFFAKTFLQDSENAINSSHNQPSTAVPAGLAIFKPALKQFSPNIKERPLQRARIPAPAHAHAL